VARNILKSRVFLVAACALAMPEARATGSLSCTIDDANLALVLFASTNREHGTIVGVTEGTLTLKEGALTTMGREFKLEGEHVIQQWFLQRELRIAINVENDNGSLLLAITGQGNPTQERYSGRYSLKVSSPDGGTRTATGRIKGCSAD
jgi:hypothetical protein